MPRQMPSPDLKPCDLAPGLLIGDKVVIGGGTLIGGGAVIHGGVEIGERARIGDHAQIRDGARIGAGTTIGSFSSVDPGVLIGERVSVRLEEVDGVNDVTIVPDPTPEEGA